MLKQIDRYIARLTIVPIVATLTVAVLLLLLENMYRLFSLTLVQGQPLAVVWQMLGSLVPEYLALGIPLSLLLGIMMAFRRLALSSELDALQSIGCSYFRLMKVPLMMAVPMAGLAFVTVGYIQPIAEYGLQTLLFEVKTGQFGLSIKLGEMVRVSDDVVLNVRNISADDERLDGIFARIADKDNQGQTVITANSGRFLRTNDSNILLLRLTNGQAVQRDSLTTSPRVMTFDRYDVPVHLPESEGFRSRGSRENELTLPELERTAHSPLVDPMAQRRASGELNRRLVLVVLPFVIPFLAVASAIPPKRSTSGLGMVLGFSALIALFKVLDFGAAATSLPAVPLLWGSFGMFSALSITMFYGLSSATGKRYIDLAYVWAERLMAVGGRRTTRRKWTLERVIEWLHLRSTMTEARRDVG
jgi:lipopolysaccharide export system permease protein